MKFTVNRETWLRGEAGGSFLLRKADGKMCCLGFLALACGATEDDIYGRRYPEVALSNEWQWPAGILNSSGGDSQECCLIMVDNDTKKTEDAERERLLTEKFNAIGIEVTFEG